MIDLSSLQNQNANTIEKELAWLQQLWLLRGRITFELSESEESFEKLLPPDISDDHSAYSALISQFKMNFHERIVLLLALIPHIKPAFLDMLQIKNQNYDLPFTEFGGIKGEKHKGMIPTGETAMFILGGTSLNRRFNLLYLFEHDHFFTVKNILRIESSIPGEPMLSGALRIAKEYQVKLTTSKNFTPNFDGEFPAKRIQTKQEWSDLIVNDSVLEGIAEIKNWLKFGTRLKDDFKFGRRIKPGFKVLFTGPPGTGKTMTASLLGKTCNMEVYRVDLSMIVSKFIGETEKNLARVFDQATDKNWILFFDEADALFGKRSQTSDSHDRYANQEVSFLLQRIEDFDGLVILCSNFKNNIDEAFFRRFQLVVNFSIPDNSQRLALWQTALHGEFKYDTQVDLEDLSEKHELTAAEIINVLRYCLLKSLERNDNTVSNTDLKNGIKIEKMKEGKIL
ncbi:ATP-binding protein [Algoriphagus aquimarinus]|uniref:ATPase family associated with various cellular activities (AAA) n=1 Tax=Algoriphagus aquimarinus TaxID=237018 RepID=A0A1I1BSV6_9BACT|nr:ATP-binding protein [Algoriphagus aquimarinus]SFB53371.1 ATPase family associated with various cellular activities (AAA) [Algoriphagus aquimarinus]